MNDSEVERQIDQMVRFIKQEAEEKANEIGVSAEEEFNIEKLQLLETEKARIRKEYERREGQIDVKKKIEFSKQLNESRLKVLQARENAVQTIVKEAHHTLTGISNDKKQYKALLADLLAQAVYKLSEPSALLKLREADLPLADDAISSARQKYKQVFGSEAPGVSVDKQSFLPPGPKAGDSDEFASCCGGVSVASGDGKIICANTLDERLRIAYEQNLPAIRATLFGEDAPVRA
ncbi:hypothetical protein WJX72_006258 [[Myrmecia] bisecta]|uniref:Vacuolar ATP synthase subunit E n=1 Tax=[Myrmecia] bisecta TaxID=41462 RepID=A0AAW1R6W6_9CHLO